MSWSEILFVMTFMLTPPDSTYHADATACQKFDVRIIGTKTSNMGCMEFDTKEKEIAYNTKKATFKAIFTRRHDGED